MSQVVHSTSHYTRSTIEIWTYPKVSVCYERLPCLRVSHSFVPTLANETRKTDQLILCPILLIQNALISVISGIRAFCVSSSTLPCEDRPVLGYILRHCRGNLQMYGAEQRSPIYQPTGVYTRRIPARNHTVILLGTRLLSSTTIRLSRARIS